MAAFLVQVLPCLLAVVGRAQGKASETSPPLSLLVGSRAVMGKPGLGCEGLDALGTGLVKRGPSLPLGPASVLPFLHSNTHTSGDSALPLLGPQGLGVPACL